MRFDKRTHFHIEYSEYIRYLLLLHLQLVHINQAYYNDIIVERAITKLCGYPLCLEELGEQPKQQYKISLVHNKVYDITERKDYCSNVCYKASLYLKEQILTTPLWVRKSDDTIPKFKLLNISDTRTDTKNEKKVNIECGKEANNKSDVNAKKKCEKNSSKTSVDNADKKSEANDNKIVEGNAGRKSSKIVNNEQKSEEKSTTPISSLKFEQLSINVEKQ